MLSAIKISHLAFSGVSFENRRDPDYWALLSVRNDIIQLITLQGFYDFHR